LFGSALSKDFNSTTSDLDFIAHFSESIGIDDFAENFFSFQFALEDLFQKNVDLMTSKELKNPILIREIESSKVQVYAA
jgi:predicted nucleotidyltransferase